jgi:hypothetical protein
MNNHHRPSVPRICYSQYIGGLGTCAVIFSLFEVVTGSSHIINPPHAPHTGEDGPVSEGIVANKQTSKACLQRYRNASMGKSGGRKEKGRGEIYVYIYADSRKRGGAGGRGTVVRPMAIQR